VKKNYINFRDVRDFNSITREAYFKQVFERIYETLGHTCRRFPECNHKVCNDSHEAWALAELALYSTGARRYEEETKASARYTETQGKFGLVDNWKNLETDDGPERVW
jgi:hypothetical protein